MINLLSFLILTFSIFIMMIFLSRRGPLQNQKAFLALAFSGWIIAAGVFVVQESIHYRVISGECKTSELPSQMLPLPKQ